MVTKKQILELGFEETEIKGTYGNIFRKEVTDCFVGTALDIDFDGGYIVIHHHHLDNYYPNIKFKGVIYDITELKSTMEIVGRRRMYKYKLLMGENTPIHKTLGRKMFWLYNHPQVSAENEYIVPSRKILKKSELETLIVGSIDVTLHEQNEYAPEDVAPKHASTDFFKNFKL